MYYETGQCDVLFYLAYTSFQPVLCVVTVKTMSVPLIKVLKIIVRTEIQ